MAELLPCPFCGGEAVLHETDWCEPLEFNGYCMNCHAWAPGSTDRAKAIAAWNQRAPDKRQAAFEAAAGMARDAWMLPKEGGPPIEAARRVCEDLANRFLALAAQAEKP